MRRILLSALALSPLFLAAANAQNRPQIILYQEDNFRGQQLVVEGDIARLKQAHFDDRVSSVRVISGTWEICENDVFKGRCITLRDDVRQLDRMGFDDKASSIRLVSRYDRGNDRRDDRRDRYDDRRRDR